MDSPLLAATGVSRLYGTFQALAPLNLALHTGELAILTGPNGAGKSTLLLCLSGLVRPSSGSVHVEGYDLYRDEVETKKRLAFVPDVPRFYLELTAWEHLGFMAMAHGAREGFEGRAEALMHRFGLWEARDLFPHNYSRGMRLKLGLLMALIRPFRVLLLDEPTSALDAEAVVLLEESLLEACSDGAAVLLTTHSPEQAARLPGRRLRMVQGRLEED